MEFVLDNSVAMRWHLASEKVSDQRYAESVLISMSGAAAIVPTLWHVEAANVLFKAEKARISTVGEVERFISQLEDLPISVDTLTSSHALGRTLSLSRAYGLSSCDAAYLELAVRLSVPLATLDKDLRKAAKKASVELYLKT